MPYLLSAPESATLENPQLKQKQLDQSKDSDKSDYKRLLSSPVVQLALLGTMFCATCQGFIESFLEEYLKIFNLSVTEIGISFLGMSVPYMIATPIWGLLVDKWFQPEVVNPIGHLIIAASFILVGPVDYIGMQPDYLLTLCGLGLVGVGTAATITSTFALAQKHALILIEEGDMSRAYQSEQVVWLQSDVVNWSNKYKRGSNDEMTDRT